MSVNIGINIQRSPNRINQQLRDAGALGKYPKLLLDFKDNYYLANGGSKTLANAVTHSMSSNSTMVDSDGYIKWAPHNLLTYSEQFDNAAWTKTNTAITANAVASPDGTQTADLIKETINNAEHFILQSASVTAGVSITGFAFAKAQNRNFFRLAYGSAAGNPFAERVAWFDLSDGSLGTQPTGDSSSSITSLGDGWYLCSLTIIPDNTASIPFVLAVSDADYGSSSAAYTGDGSSGIYAWGAHLYRSDLGGMVDNPDQPASRASYVPTTSSAKWLPRVGHHVYNGSAWANEGLLAESEARTNLFHYSHDFSNSYWAKAELTVTADQGIAPDGTNTAFKLTESSTSSSRHVTRGGGTLANSTQYTAAVYLKKGTRTKAKINVFTGAASHTGKYDIENGTVYSNAGAESANIEDVGNGWFRCSITTTTAATGNPNVAFGMLPDDYAVSYDGDGSSYIYAWGATLEASPTRSSYIPTIGAATVTRAAETFTIPSANLPWPEPNYIGSELVTNGDFSNGKTGFGEGGDGSGSVSNEEYTIVRGSIADQTLSQAVTTVVGKVYEFSVDVSVNTGGKFKVVASGSGTLADSGYFDLGTTGKISLPFVANTTSTTVRFQQGGGSGSTSTFDNFSVREIDPLSVCIAMDGRMTFADTGNANEALMYRWFDDIENRIQAFLSTFGTLTGGIYSYMEYQDTADSVGTAGDYYTPDILTPYNMAARYGSTFVNAAHEGVALTADTTPVGLPDLSSIDMTIAHGYMGTIGTFRVWDKDIGDDGLVEATNPSLEPSLSLTFEGAGTNSFVVNDWSE